MNNQVIILDDFEWEGKRLQCNFQYVGLKPNYISEQELAITNKIVASSKVIIVIGHTAEFVLRNIINIRKISNVPIIAISDFKNISDKINVLNMGADDYLLLPFIEEELFAKVKAMIRRRTLCTCATEPEHMRMDIKDIVLDLQYKTVYKNGHKVNLTKTEYKILFYLMKNAGSILSVQQISYYVWKEYSQISNNSIICHIHNIRKKLGSNGNEQKYIETIKGMGYRLKTD